MALTRNNFTGNGITTNYTIGWTYINDADVKVTINGTATTAFTVAGQVITFNTAPADQAAIVIFRDTANDNMLAEFQAGSAIRASDLNENYKQTLFVTQESDATSVRAETNSINAVNTANTAETNSVNAVNTANTAEATANTALATISELVIYDGLNFVNDIPAVADNDKRYEVQDSTGIESFSPLTGLPANFVGSSDLRVRIRYNASASTYVFVAYDAVDPENQYVRLDKVAKSDPITVTVNNQDVTYGITAATQSARGTMSAADKTKIDGIEAGATADQTAAEIRTLVDAASDSNVFTDADHSKLDGIEAGATGDQTAAEIRTLVDDASDSNVFTDADHSKLDGIESGATADQTAAEIRSLVDSASDSNVFTDADHTKLDGIEANATADLTGAEIKSLYEGEANAFTDAQFTKLAGIETGATADQTAAEIRTLVESASDSNVFTDADHTKLDGIAAGAEVNVPTNLSYTASSRELASSTGTNVTLPEVSAGGNSGLITGADKSKIDGIEAGATGDQTASEIRTLVDAASDSNVFTDADHTKLNGIESGATADQTKADIDALNIDADTLDGQHGSYYRNASNLNAGTISDARLPATISSDITGNADTVDNLHANSFIRADNDDNVTGHTEWQDNYEIRLGTSADFRMDFNGTDTVFRNYAHSGGDIFFQGENSQGTNQNLIIMDTSGTRGYVRLFENNTEKLKTTSGGVEVTGTVTATTFSGNATTATTATNCSRSISSGNGLTGGGVLNANRTLSVQAANNTIGVNSSGVFVQGANVTAGNADKVDNLHASSFIRSDANDTSTGVLTLQANTDRQLILNRNIGTPANYYNDLQIEIRATSGTAGIGLHRNGNSHCGIYIDTRNQLKFNMNNGTPVLNHNVGTIWGSGNDGSGSGLDADKVDGIQASSFLRSDANDTATGQITFTNNVYIGDQIRIGDDAWIEDFNVANTIRIKGNQNSNQGYLAFANRTTKLGCNNSNVLFYNDQFRATRVVADNGSRTDAAFKFNGDNDTGFYRIGSNDMGIVTGGNVRIRIQSSGQSIHSAQGSPTRAHLFKSGHGNSSSRYVISGYRGTTANDASGGTEVFRVRTNGGTQNQSNFYGSLSDGRLKENIVDAKSQWDDVKALRLVNFNFIEEVGYGPEKLLGFIAQEVEEICPQLVDSDDLDDEEAFVPGQKSVRNSIIMTKAFGALQEAMARIEQLEARIAQLETP